jgi:hypothetical protein
MAQLPSWIPVSLERLSRETRRPVAPLRIAQLELNRYRAAEPAPKNGLRHPYARMAEAFGPMRNRPSIHLEG